MRRAPLGESGASGVTAQPKEGKPATVPPEARGVARDGVRLMVTGGGGFHHGRFRDISLFLRPGDLLVVNDSATLPAALDGVREDGRNVTVHFSTHLDDGSWAVEVRPPGKATGPASDARAGERIELPDGSCLRLEEPWPWPETERERLWRAVPSDPGDILSVMRDFARPIAYAYVDGRWPISAYQTVFSRRPGSAEMPSAARSFTQRILSALMTAEVTIAPVTLHTGVSSLEAGEGPLPERFVMLAATAALINATRRAGGRVVAVGTTAARAVETVASPDGVVSAGSGWTELVLSPDRRARAIDGIVTGWHAEGASHLLLLEAVVGPAAVARAYEEAISRGYLWHEFGDSCLMLA